MIEEDLKRWKKHLDGEFFPWDAPMYPGESKMTTRMRKSKFKTIGSR